MDTDLNALKKNLKLISKDQWQELFALIPEISKAKSFGKFVGMKKQSDGVYDSPYWDHSKIVTQFHQIVYDIGLMQSFDWPHWDRGKKCLQNAETDFNKLDIETLCKLIITIVRADRFNEGYLMSCFNKGIILRILLALKLNIDQQ